MVLTEISRKDRRAWVDKEISSRKLIQLGKLDGHQSRRAKRLALALMQADIEVELCADVNLAIWNKFVFLTGLSAVTALTRHPVGRVPLSPTRASSFSGSMNEVLLIARPSGCGPRRCCYCRASQVC